MITWSQRILNETVQSVIGPSRVSGVSDHLFKVASAGMDEGASGIQIFFLPGSTDGALNLFTELRFDKWLRAHQTVLAGDEFKTAVGGLWQDLREGVGEVFFAETGDLSIELEPWFSVGDPIFKLSILSQNPASISPDDYFAEGDCIRCMIGSALRDDRELSSREFKIGTTRLDEDGALCVSVRSEEMGAQRPEATVVVTDGFMPDDETRTFIERKKLELGSPFFAEEFLAASLRTKFTGGRGLPEVEISNPDDFEIQILFPSQASSDRQEGSDTALPFSAEVKLVNKDCQVMPTVGAQYWLQGSHRAGFYEQEPTQGFSNKRHWRIVLASLLERVKRAALRDGFRPSHYPPLSAVLSRTLDGPLSGSCISFLHLGDSGMPASVQIHCTINRVLASVIGGAYKANYFSVRSSDIDESGVRVTLDYLNYPYGLWSTPAPSALDEWVRAHATTLQSKDVDDAVSCMFEALPEDDTQEVITRSANGMKFELARSPRTNGDDVTESSYVFSIQLASASSQDAAAEDKVAAE